MTPRAVVALEPVISAFVDERLDVLEEGGGGDIVEILFKPLPSLVVAHFLGVPHQDRRRFDGWTNAIVAATASGDLASAPDAALDLFTYATELIERRRHEPSDDLISELLSSHVEVSEDWIVGFVFTMVTGGNDTTTGLLGGAAELMTNHPDQRDELLNGHAGSGRLSKSWSDSPLRSRIWPVRRPVRSISAALRSPRGCQGVLVYGAANRDEIEFGATW